MAVRLASTIYADASHEDLTYDPDGNILTRLDRAGDTLVYQYDLLDRLRIKTVPWAGTLPGHAVGTAYSLAGRVTGMSDSAGPGLSYSFDTAGRATAELQSTGGVSRVVSWTLDANGNHTALTWPDGYAVDYAYDGLDRMSTATVAGGAQLAAYTYDPLSRRTALSYNSGTSAMAYSYSDAGDLLTLSDTLGGGASVTFASTYTPAHELQSSTASNSAYVWTAPAASSSYAAVNNLNQYPSVDGGTLTWDPNGNLSTISGATYLHDPENRLVSAQSSVGNAYTYDPLGRRVMAARNSGTGTVWGGFLWGAANWSAVPTTTYLHDGDNEIAEYDSSGSLIRRFVPGAAIDDPIAQITAAGATTFFHADRQGSIIAMADTTGVLAEGPYTYDAYGNCFVGASTTSCTTLASTTEPFRFTGQRFDPDTGLYYYRARYYGPSIGRFYETDPVGYGPDINWYTYVGNDPLDGSDPTGKDCITTNGVTTCETANYKVSFPQQPGFKDFTTKSPDYHAYSIPVAASGSTLEQAQQSLVNNPTPGNPSPATPQGTMNDATPIAGGVSPVNISPVKSFVLTNQKDGQPVVVNVTEPGHPLQSGIVVREATETKNGTVVQNWGEGTSKLQSPSNSEGRTFGPDINNVWKLVTPQAQQTQSEQTQAIQTCIATGGCF